MSHPAVKTSALRRRGARGAALVQVLSVVAVAVALGMGMLAGTSMHLQAGRNIQSSANAVGLAESGVSLAMHYLQSPHRAPGLGPDGYWTGATDLSLGFPGGGTVDITVQRDAGDAGRYHVVSTGKSTDVDGQPLLQTVRATLDVSTGLVVDRALMGQGSISLGTLTVAAGSVKVQGSLENLGSIQGEAAGHTVVNLGTLLSLRILSPSETVDIPINSTIERYETYVWDDGRLYSRYTIPVTSIGNGVMDDLKATEDNPAGIYHATGRFTLNRNLRIHGTLVVEGDLVINGGNIILTAPVGYPALIVTGDIRTRNNSSFEARGVTWLRGSIRPDGIATSGTWLRFDGALLMGGNGSRSIQALAANEVRVIYNPERTIVPTLDRTQPPGVRVRSWQR